MEAVKTASETYNETLGVINDTNEEIADKYAEIQSNNYSMYVENLNNILATGSANMQEYDYYLNKMADDFYNLSESATYLNSKITQTQSTLGAYETHWNSLVTAKANNAITDADYYAGLT
jgi:chromosome segregation ATPase